jgi:hypothetical protein
MSSIATKCLSGESKFSRYLSNRSMRERNAKYINCQLQPNVSYCTKPEQQVATVINSLTRAGRIVAPVPT